MLTEKARQEKNSYQRSYYRKNKDKVRKQNESYWERVAQRSQANKDPGKDQERTKKTQGK